MSQIVISQPMFFPWVGLFEQLRQADVFIHLDDVQLPQGRSFMTRVQLKTPHGADWLTMPVKRQGRMLNEVMPDEDQPWREKHLKSLRHAFARAPFVGEMLELVERVYAEPVASVADLNIRAIEAIAAYFGLSTTFVRSSDYQILTTSSQRLLDLLKRFDGTCYITGHGARNYLDHQLFEQSGVTVRYMLYEKVPYPQLHGEFTPYVSILDLIANCGRQGVEVMCSGTLHWKEFVNE